MTRTQDHDSLHELSTLIFNIIRSPPPPTRFSERPLPLGRRPPPITPAGFVAMLMGVSIAMMVCGWVTFFIGFFLMPWVLGLAMVLYFVGIVSTVSMIFRAVFSPIKKESSAWKLL